MVSAQILVVDDDRLVLSTLSSGLRRAGYRTAEANSGESAIRIARELTIDLAIVDVNMPGMSGVELAHHLRSQEKSIPCLFLSAYTDIAIVERAVGAGAFGYLVKPLDVPNIIPSIEAALIRAKETSDLKKNQEQLNITVGQIRADGAACLASLVDSAMDAIITVDEAYRILLFNRSAEEVFRCKAADVIGQHLERFIPQRFRAMHDAKVSAFGATGLTNRAMGRRGEVVGLRADGEEFVVEAAIASAMVGGRKQFTVMLRDITERKRAEEERQRLEVQLRESQKMEAIGTLAGGIAHDFNNILTAILGNATLARRDLGAESPALVSLVEIGKAGERGKRLVQQILAFSRKQPQEMADEPLRPLVDECVRMLRAVLPAGVQIVIASSADSLWLRADATQIEQVLLNLCINAWQAMEGRAGRIEIKLEEVALDVAAAQCLPGLQPGRYARLGVSDNGDGMDAATQARIFEPFFTTKAAGKGTGLGLSVVHGIVKAHLGAITVRSARGEGTTFDLYFPVVAAPHAEPAPKANAAEPARGSGQHLLYVDDDEALVFLLTRMLHGLGYRVSGFLSASSALAALRARPEDFDLVLTDFNMPDMSGLDLAKELARTRPDLPVVIASGYITEELQTSARRIGLRKLIYKPSTIDELCQSIQPLLATANAREPARASSQESGRYRLDGGHSAPDWAPAV